MTRRRLDGAERPPLGRPFWWLWTSSAFSNLADGVIKVALPLVAARSTQSPALIGGLAVALSIPWLLFSLPAGALTDRLDRRRVLMWVNACRVTALTVLAIAAVLGPVPLWSLFALAVLLGTVETLYDTSAQSLVPQLVPPAALSRANGRLFAAEETANQFLGPPLAGVLLAVATAAVIAAPAALWAFALLAVLFVRGSFGPDPRRAGDTATSLMAEIREGVGFLWRQPVLRRLAACVGAANLATNAMFAVFVLYAVGPSSAMGLSDQGYGLLLTATAAGGLLGSVVAAPLERRWGRRLTLLVGSATIPVLVGTAAVTATPIVIAAALFLGGLGIVTTNVVIVSVRQLLTPARMLGRVTSVFRLVAWGTIPLGSGVGAVIGEAVNLRTVFAVAAVVAVGACLGLLGLDDERLQTAEQVAGRDPDPTPA